MGQKQPGFYFYTGEWKKEPTFNRISKSAKGCWIDMLVIMSESRVRGVLCDADGNPWTVPEIAAAIGLATGVTDISENVRDIEELLARGVASRNQRGAIFNRRMVNEEKDKANTRDRVRNFRERQKDVTRSVTPMYQEEEREVGKEKEVLSSSFLEQEIDDLKIRIQKIGFRDSKGMGSILPQAADSQLAFTLSEGADPVELLEKLCRIFKWTDEGTKAPRLHEVIRRWQEPQGFWERKPDAKSGEHSTAEIRADKGRAAVSKAFAKHITEAGAANAGDADVLPKRSNH